jgi:hypothetical protein
MVVGSVAYFEALGRRPRGGGLPVAVVLVFALAVGLCAALTLPGVAGAMVQSASVIDGPSNAIVDVDGTAMAPDGTGGLVYRKEVGGFTHVFAAPFANGRWGAPLRVDIDNSYGASEPAIAAGSGGRLLVVWVQPRNVNAKGVSEYELMSSTLQPGAGEFGPPVPVDSNVGEPDTGDISAVSPSLAMAPSGAAYVVYRVVEDDCRLGEEVNHDEAECRPGTTDEVVQVRVARFDFYKWDSLGVINRAPQIALLDPTSSNAPSIGIDLEGGGLVAWQEPDSSGVARIWVRRLFGNVLGNVLQASPETLGGRPVSSNAEAPVVAVSPYGEARIAYRIQGAPGSAVAATQLFVNSIPSAVAPKGSQLTGPVAVPGATGAIGDPAAAIEHTGGFRLAWTDGGTVQELSGSDEGTGSAVAIGSSTGQALTTINPAGGGTTAWPAAPGGLPAVAVREDYANGAFEQAQLAGNVAGPVAGLSLAGSGGGDALLGWTQGPIGQAEVVGDFVLAPPAPFNLITPVGWIRAQDAVLEWESSPSAVAGVTYTVYVDGKPRIKGLTGLSARLSPAGLGNGVHRVQVLATDASGQQTMSAIGVLKIDATAPSVTVTPIDHHEGVRVTVRDSASGVQKTATRISFGDGTHLDGHAQASHRYRHAGTYTITAQVRDKAGDHATIHIRVRAQ